MSINKVILKGRLGNNPENKNKVVKFSLATSEKWTDKDGQKQEKTQWHNIVAFGKLGEILEKYLSKGDEVLIIGKVEYSENDGKYYTNIIANEFDFVGSSNKQENNYNKSNEQEEEHNDLPF